MPVFLAIRGGEGRKVLQSRLVGFILRLALLHLSDEGCLQFFDVHAVDYRLESDRINLFFRGRRAHVMEMVPHLGGMPTEFPNSLRQPNHGFAVIVEICRHEISECGSLIRHPCGIPQQLELGLSGEFGRLWTGGVGFHVVDYRLGRSRLKRKG